MHMHTLHNKLTKPESLWSGSALSLNLFQLCYCGKEMCFFISESVPLVLLTTIFIVIIHLYFELLTVLLLPLFQTVQILKLRRCYSGNTGVKKTRECAQLLSPIYYVYIYDCLTCCSSKLLFLIPKQFSLL
jgi:hypothetical protein